MDVVYRFRVLVIIIIAVVLFHDYLGLGTSRSDRQSDDGLKLVLVKKGRGIHQENLKDSQQEKLIENLKESCLPKMLCEMAAKPLNILSDKEKKLLDLIESTTLAMTWQISPSKWHFATHMGQLLRDTMDSISGSTIGCSELWPKCHINAKKLRAISTKTILY